MSLGNTDLDKDLYALEGTPSKQQELAEPKLRLQNQGITKTLGTVKYNTQYD